MKTQGPRLFLLRSKAVSLGAALACLLVSTVSAEAARISEMSNTSLLEQAVRFFTFQDPAVRYALLGSMLLGITSAAASVPSRPAVR